MFQPKIAFVKRQPIGAIKQIIPIVNPSVTIGGVGFVPEYGASMFGALILEEIQDTTAVIQASVSYKPTMPKVNYVAREPHGTIKSS